MNKIFILIITLFITIPTFTINKDTNKIVNKTIISSKIDADGEKFRNDMINSILEFIMESGVNPDSVYLPFRNQTHQKDTLNSQNQMLHQKQPYNEDMNR